MGIPDPRSTLLSNGSRAHFVQVHRQHTHLDLKKFHELYSRPRENVSDCRQAGIPDPRPPSFTSSVWAGQRSTAHFGRGILIPVFFFGDLQLSVPRLRLVWADYRSSDLRQRHHDPSQDIRIRRKPAKCSLCRCSSYVVGSVK